MAVSLLALAKSIYYLHIIDKSMKLPIQSMSTLLAVQWVGPPLLDTKCFCRKAPSKLS